MVLLIKRGYNISRDSARRGIENSHWHGRLQILKEDPLVYYDVAHNPAAAQALSDFLREIFPARKAKVIMGMMKDKDAGNFIRNLIPIAKEFIFVDLNNPRGLEPYLLSEAAQAEGVPFKVIPEAGEAINVVMCEALEEEIILITGSHYLGEAVYNFFGLQNT
jgi:dihydrofolate synthase/folylpolyglutamate synthase